MLFAIFPEILCNILKYIEILVKTGVSNKKKHDEIDQRRLA